MKTKTKLSQIDTSLFAIKMEEQKKKDNSYTSKQIDLKAKIAEIKAQRKV